MADFLPEQKYSRDLTHVKQGLSQGAAEALALPRPCCRAPTDRSTDRPMARMAMAKRLGDRAQRQATTTGHNDRPQRPATTTGHNDLPQRHVSPT
jgi:hypothetical protein